MTVMIGTTVAAAPAPKPAAVSPAASPRLSANHLSALPTHVPYTAPAPTPAIAATTYSIVSECPNGFSVHDRATTTPPNITTIRGPNRSTNHPSMGTSHVSVATKIVNATWMLVRPQWNLASIGSTKYVHPYCRFAIITMQTTPATSWTQRFTGATVGVRPSTIGIRASLWAAFRSASSHRHRRFG